VTRTAHGGVGNVEGVGCMTPVWRVPLILCSDGDVEGVGLRDTCVKGCASHRCHAADTLDILHRIRGARILCRMSRMSGVHDKCLSTGTTDVIHQSTLFDLIELMLARVECFST
jgi:hypothetical protein